MTPTEQKVHEQKIRDAAQRDIADIDTLSKSEAFNRYFVGQLNRLYHDNVDMALKAKGADEREKARHCAVFIKELTEMPASQRQACEKILRTPIVDHDKPQRPVQVG